MTKLPLAALLICLAGCQTTAGDLKMSSLLRDNLPELHKRLDNDCLLVAINVKYAIDSNRVLAGCSFKRILAIEYFKASNPEQSISHAALVFVYPNGSPNFYIYDERGCEAFTGNPMSVSTANLAQLFFNACGSTGIVTKAYYITK